MFLPASSQQFTQYQSKGDEYVQLLSPNIFSLNKFCLKVLSTSPADHSLTTLQMEITVLYTLVKIQRYLEGVGIFNQTIL